MNGECQLRGNGLLLWEDENDPPQEEVGDGGTLRFALDGAELYISRDKLYTV